MTSDRVMAKRRALRSAWELAATFMESGWQ
jgi:hypothetical protein